MKNYFVLLLFPVLLIASCTEAYKHKQEAARNYVDDMQASGVTCGIRAETNNGVSREMTTFTFSGCSPDLQDVEREWIANRVAYGLVSDLAEKDLEGETHLEIIAEIDGGQREYLFELPHLRKTKEFLQVVDQALDACIANDGAKLNALKDDALMPDEVMGNINAVMQYNDSLYRGQQLTTEMFGYRFASGEKDPDLKLFSVDYDVTGQTNHTLYTINVDCKTGKVVYVWMKTIAY